MLVHKMEQWHTREYFWTSHHGFNKNNTIVLAIGYQEMTNEGYIYNTSETKSQIGGMDGSVMENKILAHFGNSTTIARTVNYKIILMKIV